MNMISESNALCAVTLPAYAGRRVYMHTTTGAHPDMPTGFEAYVPAIAKLCRVASHTGVIHVTVDEKVVRAGMSQRRPGAHVDGRFEPARNSWGGGGGGGWNHFCNRLPVDRMAVIVASDVPGCIVYPGEFTGGPKEGGDCEHMRPQFEGARMLQASHGHLLSPDCVHESVVFDVDTRRAFLRIALEPKGEA